MVSLCPHLFEVYFEKTDEILKTYEAQIQEQINYSQVFEGLLFRKVISQKQNESILLIKDRFKQMEETIKIVKKRVWGLENFIIVLMEEKCNLWLVEQLYQSYTQYLVAAINKQKLLKCDCSSDTSILSSISRQWTEFIKSVDSWVYEAGTSIGFINQAIYPTKNLLSFINDKLPIPKLIRKVKLQQNIKPIDFATQSAGNFSRLELEDNFFQNTLEFTEVENEPIDHGETQDVNIQNNGDSSSLHIKDVDLDMNTENNDDYESGKLNFNFSRTKSSSEEALYRKDISNLLNFHDLTSELEMLEWDDENEIPEFNMVDGLNSTIIPTLEVGTQTISSSTDDKAGI